jgi:glyoxylase-like metal-dependent hydrolase (beta-lactamase superfamily II)
MKTTLIHPATFKLDGGAMFGIIPKPLWERKISPDEQNRINMSLRLVLFETNNKKVLVDTGLGDYHQEKFKSQFDVVTETGPLTSALKELEIKPEDITDIIITHLHFDHVGGLGFGPSGADIIFKNATIHVHAEHFKYAQKPTLRDSGSFHSHTFMPLLNWYAENGKLNLLTEDSDTIINDENETIKFKTSFGHTPYMIHPYTTDHIYMADLVPMRHHLSLPWVMGYDIEPGTTTKYKEIFYNFISQNNLTMIFEHDNDVWGGKLIFDEKGKPKLKDDLKSNQTLTQKII